MAIGNEARAGKYTALPAILPSANVPEDIDLTSVALDCTRSLGSILSGDIFTEDAIWRDVYAFTGTLRTFYGVSSVISTWKELASTHKPHSFEIVPDSVRCMKIGNPVSHAWIHAMFTFKTELPLPATCSGFLGITPGPDGDWKIWTLRTILENFQGIGDVDVPTGVSLNGHAINDYSNGHKTNGIEGTTSFDVVIVGAGQAGLSTAGRLNALKVRNVILEANNDVGGNWTSRYESAKLHTPKEYGHLPFDRSFVEDDPELLPRESLAAAYKRYVDKYNINIMLSTRVENMTWSPSKEQWTITISNHGESREIKAAQVVLANGLGLSTPYIPDLPNREVYKGKVLHATQYTNSRQWKGLKGIIVGTANTAHDVAQDMVAAGLSSVTMMQRNPTYVFPVSHVLTSYKPLFNTTLPTPLSDRLSMTQPHAMSRLLANNNMHALARADNAYYDSIRSKTNLKVVQFGDINAHIFGNAGRSGGHYIDVGNVENIVAGRVGVVSGGVLGGFSERGLRLGLGVRGEGEGRSEGEDGKGGKKEEGEVEVEGDVIVFATGFKNDVSEMTERMCGREVREKVEEGGGGYWGVDGEGEVRGAYRPTGHQALWYMGGPIGPARFYSRFVALSIKARLMGKPLPVYRENVARVV